jgi:hypothetical protein
MQSTEKYKEETMGLQIEKGIPIPQSGSRTHARKYPFDEMEIGDSVLVEDDRVYSAVSVYSKRNGKKYATRKVEGGIRVWRIK